MGKTALKTGRGKTCVLNRAIYKERNTVTSFLDVQINVSSVFQYFLIYLMLLIPGSCLFAKYFLGDWKYYVLLVFYAALFVSGKKYREGYAPVFALLLLVFVVVTRLITDGGAGLSAWMQFAVCLASVHFAVCCNRRMFLTRFVKLVCVFSVISLVFWLLFLVFPQLADIYPAQTYFTQSIGSDPAWAKDYYGKGLFLYSYLEIHPTRNCGIYTEPGVHQIVLNGALFVMLFWGNKLTGLTGRKYFWRLAVLVFTVLSCQSTAGYIGFLLIVVFFMFSRRVRSKGRYAAKAKRALAMLLCLAVIVLLLEYQVNGAESILNKQIVEKLFAGTDGVSLMEGSGQYRVGTILLSVRSVIEHPLGVGYDRFIGLTNRAETGFVAASVMSFAAVYGVIPWIVMLAMVFVPVIRNESRTVALLFMLLFLNTTLAQTDLLYPALMMVPVYLEATRPRGKFVRGGAPCKHRSPY